MFDAKIKEYINRTTVPGKLFNKTLQEKMEDVFMATVTFEEFAVRFGQHHLIYEAAPAIQLSSEKMGKESTMLSCLLNSWAMVKACCSLLTFSDRGSGVVEIAIGCLQTKERKNE